MSDIKLFKQNKKSFEELKSDACPSEKELQKFIEKNMESLLRIKFLKTEYAIGIGERNKRYIDTLGIDEDSHPVIIEYKKSANRNVISQLLEYDTQLRKNPAEFKLLVIQELDKEATNNIRWTTIRLLCIACKFDPQVEETAVKQKIELIRYKKYDDIVLLEQVAKPAYARTRTRDKTSKKQRSNQKAFSEIFNQVDDNLRNLYQVVEAFIKSLSDDVRKEKPKNYVVFKRNKKNFVCAVPKPQKKRIHLFLNLDFQDLKRTEPAIKSGLIYDVKGKGHEGTGDLKATISNMEDFKKVKDLIKESYEAS